MPVLLLAIALGFLFGEGVHVLRLAARKEDPEYQPIFPQCCQRVARFLRTYLMDEEVDPIAAEEECGEAKLQVVELELCCAALSRELVSLKRRNDDLTGALIDATQTMAPQSCHVAAGKVPGV